jgi:hypothetical protein
MSDYFGKNCKYLCGKWEEEQLYPSGDETYKESVPDLIFCNHPDNKDTTEGNCTKKLCPLIER